MSGGAGSRWRSTSPVLQGIVLVCVSLLSGAVGYTAARWSGHGALKDAQADFRAERADLEERRSSLESELLEARASHAADERASTRRLQVLEARRQLAKAIEALDERNFGTASARLSTASALLDRDSQSDVLRDLADDIGTSELTVSDDLAEARSTVGRFASRLDATLTDSGRDPEAAPTAVRDEVPEGEQAEPSDSRRAQNRAVAGAR